VAGADIWLNTPRRPLEASGTSGQKIVIHGGLNLSIMDGWWREAYQDKNGWPIGDDSSDTNFEAQDERDAEHLFKTLTEQIIPEFYQRNAQGVPTAWVKRIRNAMLSLIPVYNTDRMVAEYVRKYYLKQV
jgi:starch phosphorylase